MCSVLFLADATSSFTIFYDELSGRQGKRGAQRGHGQIKVHCVHHTWVGLEIAQSFFMLGEKLH